jgi:hypothetical protein
MKRISISMAPPAGDRFLLQLSAAQHRRIRLAALISGESLTQFCRHATSDLADTILNYTLECGRKDNGRFVSKVPELTGVMVVSQSCRHCQARLTATQPSTHIFSILGTAYLWQCQDVWLPMSDFHRPSLSFCE